MKKSLMLLVSILSLGLAAPAFAQSDDNAERIAEIESQIKELEAELKELKGDLLIHDTNQILSMFQDSNLAVYNPKEMKFDDFGLGPFVEGGSIFGVQENSESYNGYDNARLVITDDLEQLDKLEKYYVDLGKESAMYYSHVFRKGTLLLQMSSNVSEDIFNKYVELIK